MQTRSPGLAAILTVCLIAGSTGGLAVATAEKYLVERVAAPPMVMDGHINLPQELHRHVELIEDEELLRAVQQLLQNSPGTGCAIPVC